MPASLTVPAVMVESATEPGFPSAVKAYLTKPVPPVAAAVKSVVPVGLPSTTGLATVAWPLPPEMVTSPTQPVN